MVMVVFAVRLQLLLKVTFKRLGMFGQNRPCLVHSSCHFVPKTRCDRRMRERKRVYCVECGQSMSCAEQYMQKRGMHKKFPMFSASRNAALACRICAISNEATVTNSGSEPRAMPNLNSSTECMSVAFTTPAILSAIGNPVSMVALILMVLPAWAIPLRR